MFNYIDQLTPCLLQKLLKEWCYELTTIELHLLEASLYLAGINSSTTSYRPEFVSLK